ncbi:MAG: hypothetical protein OQK51_03445 [Kangiellaceae bacterium]|nr:hypothetical protein [Kangiellaceae bacterium]
MNSYQTSIYEYEEVLYTLAWLSGCNTETDSKKIICQATNLGLVTVDDGSSWKANKRAIFKQLNNPDITFPHHSCVDELAKILIGLGEISARCHGDFNRVVTRKLTSCSYKAALLNVIKKLIKTPNFLKRKRTLEEIAYSQKIGKTDFDWGGIRGGFYEIDSGTTMRTFNYGLAFIIRLCIRLIPEQYSVIVESYKEELIVGDLCCPVIEPLMFRKKQYIVPLLKSKNAYLKLLACVCVVKQSTFDTQSTIGENIKMLVANGIDIGDALWLSSLKLKEHYQSADRIKERILSTKQEISVCERDPSNCPKGSKPEQWISSRKDSLSDNEDLLVKAEKRLKASFDDMKTHWPQTGITQSQVDNLIHLIEDEKLLRELVDVIPSKDNQAQILDNAFLSIMNWIGVPSQPVLEVCEETFSYSSKRNLEKLASAAKTLILLSDLKGKEIGRFLGSNVGPSVVSLEKFSCSPYMNVRKASQWQSATSRLACIHLLAMYVFEQTPSDKEKQVLEIIPDVVKKINLLLKVQDSPFHLGADELFGDLKRAAVGVISNKDYMADIAKDIVADSNLPPDYRIRVLVSNETLLKENTDLLLELFEQFGEPPIYVDRDYRHFREWLNLLDLCIAHCWKENSLQACKEVIRIWEQYCPKYGEKCREFIGYARKMYRALSESGEERDWLKELFGFENSNCMRFISPELELVG